MTLLDWLDRRLRHFAIPHLTVLLIVCQAMTYLAIMSVQARDDLEPVEARLILIPDKVLEGEVWRLFSFLILPPLTNPLFLFFFFYLFYLMGEALEQFWGAFRYNIFILIGYLATVGAAFLVPHMPATNAFLEGSVFLAFAFLCPHFELYMFFLVPVQIKWLAMLTWIIYGLLVVFGDWSARLLVLASVVNFLVFFAKDIVYKVRGARRRMAFQAAAFARKEPEFHHRCATCGITDRTHPNMDFRYCSQCNGNQAYCAEHLRSHEHVAEKAS